MADSFPNEPIGFRPLHPILPDMNGIITCLPQLLGDKRRQSVINQKLHGTVTKGSCLS
jgi:hypothetical protein